MLQTTLAGILADHAGLHPDQWCISFLKEVGEEQVRLSYGELDRRARAIAAHLQSVAAHGDRALLLFPPGIEFVQAFFGCLYAGIAAVPVYPPRSNRNLLRLEAIVADAGAAVVLTTSTLLTDIRDRTADHQALSSARWIAADHVSTDMALGYAAPELQGDTLAFLQYTSGSTGKPKGVMVSHGNLIHNIQVMRDQLRLGPDDVGVSWLPVFHDMGLIGNVLMPLCVGYPVVLMAPTAFLQKPILWLQAISRFRATISGGPNFAYDLCVQRIKPEQRSELDLRTWRVAFNGAEPIRAETLERFAEAFAPAGFAMESFCPCYGLAEATLFVSGGSTGARPALQRLSKKALEQHRADERPLDADDAQVAAGSGPVSPAHLVRIVNPESLELCSLGEVGEIWMGGPSVAQGYWQMPAETEATFGARMRESDEGPFLRTGDLGFVDDRQVLYVTGRLKDLIIIRGRNLYPQDIEWAVSRCHPALEAGYGAAFALSTAEGEQLVVVKEADRHAKDHDAIVEAVRQTVAEEFGIQVYAVVLIKPASIPKTSSGKIQRRACREAFRNGELHVVHQWVQPDRETCPVSAPPECESPARTAAEIQTWLLQKLADRLHMPVSALDPRKPFSAYGLDSAQAVELAGDLEAWLGQSMPATLVWDYPTMSGLALHLAGGQDAHRTGPEGSEEGGEPIAIVGMACRFPGADSLQAYWQLLCEERMAVREVPPDRWDLEAVYHPDPAVPGKTTSRHGGFIADVDRFDPAFFGISKREADSMDPQQRLLLECAWEACADAGLPPEQLAGSRTAVVVGISSFDYARQVLEDPTQIDLYTSTGGALSIAANRMSYLLDLRGPSVALDTACSSSLVAVHQACEYLRRGDATTALVGAANLMLSPELTINYGKMGALAPDGICRAFDAGANGTVRGEGIGALVLKRLSRARADGDRIYAVIRGSAVNQDGRSNGMTAPSRHAQEACLREAYERAGISPGQVSYVEAHGTGTPLGDPIEAAALGAVLATDRPEGRKCALGSVKTNIGHLEAAAGLAGIIKTALALKHRILPASLHYKQPNPHIPFDQLPLAVQAHTGPWPVAEEEPAVAGVSSFGFGGTNAHVVLQEYRSETPGPSVPQRPEVLLLSGHMPAALKEQARTYAEGLGAADLHSVCYTAATRLQHYDYRLAVVGTSVGDMAQELASFAADERTPDAAHPRKLAFVCSGHGGHWPGMATGLLQKEPVFRAAVERCDQLLQACGLDFSLLAELDKGEQSARLGDLTAIQLAVFATQVALAELFRSWGVVPQAVVGHSMGEVAAAHLSGALTLEDAVKVIYHRARLLRQVEETGRMAAVLMSPEQAAEALAPFAGRVYLSAINSRRSVIISGRPSDVDEAMGHLRSLGIASRLVNATAPGHCPLIGHLAPELVEVLSDLQVKPASIPMMSTVTGTFIDQGGPGAEYWGSNLREPVLFGPAVQALVKEGFDTFVELGAHPVLAANVQHLLDDAGQSGAVMPSLYRGIADQDALLTTVGKLFTLGVSVDWHGLYPEGQVVSLPAYAWQRERCWVEHQGPKAPARAAGTHPLLGVDASFAVTGSRFWETHLAADALPYLGDHRVHGMVVLPATAYLEMALSAAVQAFGPDAYTIADTAFLEALVLPAEGTRQIQLVLTEPAYGEASFQVWSRQAEADWVKHAAGRVLFTRAEPLAGPGIAELQTGQEVSADAFYGDVARRGGFYGPAFAGIKHLWTQSGSALAELKSPAELGLEPGAYQVHPALLDAALQPLGATQAAGSDLYMPVGVEQVRVYSKPGDGVWSLVRRRTAPGGEGDLITGDIRLLDASGQVLAEVVGLTARRVSQARPLDMNDAFYRVEWEEQPAGAVSTEQRGTWLIFSDGSALAEQLTASLSSRGEETVEVFPGSAFAEKGANRYELDPASPSDFGRLLTWPYRGIIYLWGIGAAESIDPDQRLACGGALHLIQALASAGGGRPAPVALVTRGAHIAHTPEQALQAPLWGLGRVAALEHPALRCLRIDLDEQANTGEAALLIRELESDGEADEIAYREGRRFVARLARHAVADAGTDTLESDNYQLVISERGNLDSLRLEAAEPKRPGPDEVLIEVMAAGLNFNDVLNTLGVLPEAYRRDVPGWECAGRVLAVGDHVTEFRPGDEVVAMAMFSLASRVVADASLVAHKPRHLGWEEAATIPVTYLTAYYALHHLGRMAPGERVLIHSAAGGVGMAAVQLAQRAGAEIFATAGSEAKRQYLQSLGIAHVFDSRTLAFADEIRTATGGYGVDLVLNSLSGEAIARGLSVLAPMGRFLEMGIMDIAQDRQIGLLPFQKGISYAAIEIPLLCRTQPALAAQLLREVMAGFADGSLKPLPFKAFPIQAAADGFRLLSQRSHMGKVVLTLGTRASVPGQRAVPVRADRTYLITGGLTGLGLLMAQWLAKQGARSLALLGRRAPSAEAESVLTTLRELGVKVTVARADVADAEQVERVLAAIRRDGPPLGGIIHAAAVLQDGILAHMPWQQFAAVLRPKVQGAWNLHQLTRQDSLDFFVVFSSLAAVLGSPGQGNYAAANAFLDALALHRRHLGLPALSLNWGPWEEVGGAARPDRAGRLALQGILPIAPAQGLAALERLLSSDAAQVVVAPADWGLVISSLPGRAPAMLDRLTRENRSLTSAGSQDLRERFRTAAVAERPALLLEHLQALTAHVLRIPPERIDVNRPLNTFGFDSLLAIELRNRMESSVGTSVPVARLMQGATIAQLAREMLAQMDLPAEPPAARLTAGESGPGDYPLSRNQLSMWFMYQLAPKSTVYNIVGTVRIPGALDSRAFHRACQQMVDRHPALRTTFPVQNREPVQRIHAHMDVDFHTVDCRGWSEEELYEQLSQEAHRPFQLEKGPLMRVALYARSAEDHVLALTIHHIVSDGWSFWLLLSELSECYRAQLESRPAALPALALAYTDYTRWQDELLRGPAGVALSRYWQDQLAGAPVRLELPTDHPRPKVATYRGAARSRTVNERLAGRLRQISAQHGTTLFTTLLAAYNLLLLRYSGQEEILVGAPTAGRNQPELAALVGYFVNTLVLRGNMTGNPSFATFLGRMRETVVDAFAHQELPFAMLVDQMKVPRDPSRNPLFQAGFSWQRSQVLFEEGTSSLAMDLPGTQFKLNGLTFESFPLTKQVAMYDLTLIMGEVGPALGAALQYSTDLFDPDTAERMLNDFERLLQAIAEAPDAPIADLVAVIGTELVAEV